MEMSGEQRIAAPRTTVWSALNDPGVLHACIPGCQSLEGSIEDGLEATVTTKIGPVKATFLGTVRFAEIVPGEGYLMTGEGKGGVAGFAKGSARVTLEDDADGTVLRYTVGAQVGGKIAQLGGRLIDTTARNMADQFFVCFRAKAEGGPSETADPAPALTDVPGQAVATPIEAGSVGSVSATGRRPDASPAPPGGNNRTIWLIAIGGLVVMAALYGIFA